MSGIFQSLFHHDLTRMAPYIFDFTLFGDSHCFLKKQLSFDQIYYINVKLSGFNYQVGIFLN